jgi:hypothetical protein
MEFDHPLIFSKTGKIQSYTNSLMNTEKNPFHLPQVQITSTNEPTGRIIPPKVLVKFYTKHDITSDLVDLTNPDIQKWLNRRLPEYRQIVEVTWNTGEVVTKESLEILQSQTRFLMHLRTDIMDTIMSGDMPLIIPRPDLPETGEILGETKEERKRKNRCRRPRKCKFDLIDLRRAYYELTVLSDVKGGTRWLDPGMQEKWKKHTEQGLVNATNVKSYSGQRFWTRTGASRGAGVPPEFAGIAHGRMPNPDGSGGYIVLFQDAYFDWICGSAFNDVVTGFHQKWLESHPTPIRFMKLFEPNAAEAA